MVCIATSLSILALTAPLGLVIFISQPLSNARMITESLSRLTMFLRRQRPEVKRMDITPFSCDKGLRSHGRSPRSNTNDPVQACELPA